MPISSNDGLTWSCDRAIAAGRSTAGSMPPYRCAIVARTAPAPRASSSRRSSGPPPTASRCTGWRNTSTRSTTVRPSVFGGVGHDRGDIRLPHSDTTDIRRAGHGFTVLGKPSMHGTGLRTHHSGAGRPAHERSASRHDVVTPSHYFNLPLSVLAHFTCCDSPHYHVF